MKLHQGVATAVVTTAAISAIIVGAYLFGILLFPSLTQRALAGPLLRGESAAQGQASANRTITSIVTVTRTIVTIGNAGCGGGDGSDKFVKEEFPAPNSNQSTSLGSVNVKNATRVGRTDRGFPLDGEQQRKVFAAHGLTWIFYSDGKNLIYQTSENGSSWGDPINVTAQPKGFHFSIWYDPASNAVFYVNVDGYSCGFWFRWGTPDSNRRVAWGIKESFVPTDGQFDTNPYVYARGKNDVWVSLTSNGGSDIEVWRNNDSGWTRKLIIPTRLGSFSILLPLSSGIALVYGVGGYRLSNQNVTTTVDGGETWSAPVSTSERYFTQSAVSVANSVYIVGLDESLKLRFSSYTVGDSSFRNERVVATAVYRGAISTNGASELEIVYADNYSIYYQSLSLSTGTWSSQKLLVTSPSPLPIHPSQAPYLITTNCNPLMIPYLIPSNELPVIWLFGDNPFVLMYSAATLPPELHTAL